MFCGQRFSAVSLVSLKRGCGSSFIGRLVFIILMLPTDPKFEDQSSQGMPDMPNGALDSNMADMVRGGFSPKREREKKGGWKEEKKKKKR